MTTIQKTLCQETVSLKKEIEGYFLVLAKNLKQIRDEELWRAEGYDSFADFLMEIDVAESTASRMISVYQTFVLSFAVKVEKLKQVGWSKLYLLSRKDFKNKTDAEDWIDSAVLKTRQDVEEDLREEKVGECLHKDYYDLRVCKSCGKKMKIYDK